MTRRRRGSSQLAGKVLSKAEVLNLIDAVAMRLSQKLPEAELAAGWSAPRSEQMRKVLLEIKGKLERHEPVPYTPLARWVDHMSISSGSLLESLCSIDVALNEPAVK
jgi:hypothetical protein